MTQKLLDGLLAQLLSLRASASLCLGLGDTSAVGNSWGMVNSTARYAKERSRIGIYLAIDSSKIRPGGECRDAKIRAVIVVW